MVMAWYQRIHMEVNEDGESKTYTELARALRGNRMAQANEESLHKWRQITN